MNKKMIYALTSICLLATPVFAQNTTTQTLEVPPQLVICPPATGHSTTIGGVMFYFPSAYFENSQLMVPLRETAERLGYTVTWDNSTQAASLNDSAVKTTVTLGQDLYYKASSTAIGLTRAKPLGAAPALKDGKMFVPAKLFELLRPVETVVEHAKGLNAITVPTNGTAYSFFVTVPDYISEYISLDLQTLILADVESYPLVLLKFENKDNVANLGSFAILTQEQLSILQEQEGPKPNIILEDAEKGIFISFSGLQDIPFVPGTIEADLVSKYHDEIDSILETVEIQHLPPV